MISKWCIATAVACLSVGWMVASAAFADQPPPTDPAPGEWREGAKEVPAALDTDPIAMITAKAFAHQLLHNYDLAAKEFGMRIARFPERPDFYRDRCWAYVAAEMHYDLAVADCEKAVALKIEQSHPDSDIFLLRAQAYVGNRQYEAAIADYDRAISMNGKNLRILLYRCEARAAWGKYPRKGWNDCASYSNQTGGDARSHEAMSLIRWRLQDFPTAIAQANMSIAIYAKRAPALYMRGVAKLRSGDKAGGDADIAAAKAIDSNIADTYAGYGVTP